MIRFLTAGESHGKALTTIIEGFPANLPIKKSYIDLHLKRRQMGYGRGGRMKIESDAAEFEKLTGNYDKATTYIKSQSFAHAVVVIFIIIGFFFWRNEGLKVFTESLYDFLRFKSIF